MRIWSALPSWWYRPDSGVLASLKGGSHAGDSQAALRVYLALVSHPKRRAGNYEVTASLSDLEAISQFSRSMVLRGIHRAQDAGLIRYSPGSRVQASSFTLVKPGEETGGWAKLPMHEIHKKIPGLPHRGATALVALKIYMVLIAARPNSNAVVALRHDTIRLKTGCQTNQLRSAVSLLAINGLVHVIAEGHGDNRAGYLVQKYHLQGKLEAPRNWADAVVTD